MIGDAIAYNFLDRGCLVAVRRDRGWTCLQTALMAAKCAWGGRVRGCLGGYVRQRRSALPGLGRPRLMQIAITVIVPRGFGGASSTLYLGYRWQLQLHGVLANGRLRPK